MNLLVTASFCLIVACCPLLPHVQAHAESLFEPSDGVTILNSTNCFDTLAEKPHVWLVTFYSSWCGHCIRFAPIVKELVKSIQDWSNVVQVAVLNCADPKNSEVCRLYKIPGFPSIRMFPAFSKYKFTGDLYPGKRKNASDIEDGIINYLQNASTPHNLKHPPLLHPIVNMKNIWEDVTGHVKFTVVLFVRNSSTLGQKVILDFSSRRDFVIRRVLEDQATKYGIKKMPSMFLIRKEGDYQLLKSGPGSHRNYSQAIWDLFNITSTTSTTSSMTSSTTSTTIVMPSSTIHINPEPFVVKIAYTLSLSNIFCSVKVYAQDLISALSYSLRHEIAVHSTITGDSLVALKSYIRVLSKYFPGDSHTSAYLNDLDTWLHNYDKESISGKEWEQQLDRHQNENAYIPETDSWIGCKGSEPKYRGYPCGLWMLFHTLTVNAARYEDDSSFNPQEVLLAMRSYIKEFFSCRECATNFAKGAKYIEERVDSADSAILFLWRSHNKANFRLIGDITEDPAHPKIQFPSYETCPKCLRKNKVQWIEDEVLKFLKSLYGRHSIEPMDRVISMRIKPRSEEYMLINGGMLSKFDLSFCLVFYGFCIVLMFLLYYHFIIRRRMTLCPQNILL